MLHPKRMFRLFFAAVVHLCLNILCRNLASEAEQCVGEGRKFTLEDAQAQSLGDLNILTNKWFMCGVVNFCSAKSVTFSFTEKNDTFLKTPAIGFAAVLRKGSVKIHLLKGRFQKSIIRPLDPAVCVGSQNAWFQWVDKDILTISIGKVTGTQVRERIEHNFETLKFVTVMAVGRSIEIIVPCHFYATAPDQVARHAIFYQATLTKCDLIYCALFCQKFEQCIALNFTKYEKARSKRSPIKNKGSQMKSIESQIENIESRIENDSKHYVCSCALVELRMAKKGEEEKEKDGKMKEDEDGLWRFYRRIKYTSSNIDGLVGMYSKV